MRVFIRLLIWVTLASCVWAPCLPVAHAQSRSQHERRLNDLEQRFEQLLNLEEWQNDRQEELGALVRDLRRELHSMNSENVELKRRIIASDKMLSQLRAEQSALRQTMRAFETAERPVVQTARNSSPGLRYEVRPLRIVPRSVNPQPTIPRSMLPKSVPVLPQSRPANGYAWPN